MVLTDDLEFTWLCDVDSSSQADATGNGNTGTVVGSPTFTTPGLVGDGDFDFQSATNVINMDSTPPIAQNTTDDFSVSCVFKWPSTPSTTAIFFQGISGGNDNFDIRWETTSGGRLKISLRDSSNSGASATTPFSADTDLHQVVLTYNNTTNTGTLYIDGSVGTTLSRNDLKVITDFKFGNDKNNGNPIDGRGDECYGWSRSISAAEVTELWNSGAPIQFPFAAGYSNKVNGITPSKINGIDVANIAAFNGV